MTRGPITRTFALSCSRLWWGRVRIMAERGTDARHLISRNARSRTAAAQQNTEFGLAADQRFRHRERVVGVVHRVGTVSSQINRLVTGST